MKTRLNVFLKMRRAEHARDRWWRRLVYGVRNKFNEVRKEYDAGAD